MTLDVSGCFSLKRRSTQKGKGKPKFAYPKRNKTFKVCISIPRAFGVKYLLQRPLCLIEPQMGFEKGLLRPSISRDGNHLKCLNFMRNEIPLI